MTPAGGRNGADQTVCSPCRGSGVVISMLGGTASQLTCPWCGGTGSFQPGRDAQQHVAPPAR
jgi:DnaJ-class molecular chaperone